MLIFYNEKFLLNKNEKVKIMGPHIDFSPHQNHANGYLHGTHCCIPLSSHIPIPHTTHIINSLK